MNFYICNSINDIDEQDISVEFSDELIDFVYKLSKHNSFDMSKLYGINPYVDVIVSQNDLSQIIEVCNYILDTSLLQNYEEPDDLSNVEPCGVNPPQGVKGGKHFTPE